MGFEYSLMTYFQGQLAYFEYHLLVEANHPLIMLPGQDLNLWSLAYETNEIPDFSTQLYLLYHFYYFFTILFNISFLVKNNSSGLFFTFTETNLYCKINHGLLSFCLIK